MGCFAVGCLTLLIIGFVLVAGVIGGTWYFCRKAADALTSSQPVELGITAPDEAQVRNAERSVTRVKTGIATGQETTVAFTAADLNALVDRDPNFSEVRGRIRFDIANSIMTMRVSAPLDEIPWSRLQNRWLNASATFGFAYAFEMFRLDLRSAEINGYQLPEELCSNFVSSFNRRLNQSFQDKIRESEGAEFWDHVKSISLEGDKLVVTTKND
ncbi:MAG: hypothetical protein DMF06_13020 [Verrucomicrobia bacterium]|nr:MAG: hypothetical protein DMF06_13020 [Verrucomicrobiota bacterium]